MKEGEIMIQDIAKSNLDIIKNKDELKKIRYANVVLNKNITLLRPIIVTLNKAVLQNNKVIELKNGKKSVQISKNEIINDQNKTTRKKLNDRKVSNLIVLACLSGCIRKVTKNDLNIITLSRLENSKSKYKEAPVYEILDLNDSHFERLKGMTADTQLTYATVCELYSKEIADNCFNRLFSRIGKLKYSACIKNEVIIQLKNHNIVQFSKMVEKISNWRLVKRERDGDVLQNHQSKSWWRKNIKEMFDLGAFDDVGLKLCKYSEVKKSVKKELPDCRGNSLVVVRI